MPGFLPTKELELQAWTTNFLNVATANLLALGLTAADLTDLQTDAGDLSSNLPDVVAARAAYEASVRAKDATVADTVKNARALARRIQNHAGVSDSLKAQLGITVPNPVKNRTAPVMPADVQAKPEAVGVNVLKWSKAGNKETTQYVILAKTLTNGARVSDTDGWNMVGQTTRAKFAHAGVTPGVPMAYKVMAARADQASLPSLPATVYGG